MRLSSIDIILIEEVYVDINNDHFKKLEIETLCRKYQLSEEKLIKGFRQLYGTDIQHYYTAICMEFAKVEFDKGASFKDLSIVFEYPSVQQFSFEFRVYLHHSRI